MNTKTYIRPGKIRNSFHDEVELASAGAVVARDLVEAITPVYTEKSDHREIYPDSDTGRPLDLERIELAYV